MTPKAILAATVMAALAGLLGARQAGAALNFSPPLVDVSTNGPTTFVIRFFEDDPARTFTTTRALFCSDVSCTGDTVLGRIPPGLDRGSTSRPVKAITDVVTVPYSVVRRAVARRLGTFFYVRSFVVQGADGPVDITLGVTLRLSGGIATTPLSLTRVDIFGEEPGRRRVRFITLDAETVGTGAVKADITYTGVGLLTGWWEVRTPADPPVREIDRFPEAALSQAERATQRTFRRVKRVRVQLPPTGRTTLEGPRYADLPDAIPGVYDVLLRIEVTRDPEALETLPAPGEPADLFFGATAGFPLPTLEYRVGTRLGRLDEREIAARVVFDPDSGPEPRLGVAWTPVTGRPLVVDLEVTERASGEARLLVAPIDKGVVFLPAEWVGERGPDAFAFTISVLGPDGRPVAGLERVRLPAPRR